MKSIIIVDDEHIIRAGLSELINNTGKYKILAMCKNGQEAFEYTTKLHPDIVITDIRMPVIDGIEYIKKCSQKNIYHLPKFIVISGFEEFEYAKSALQLKVYDYLLKPIDHANMLSILEHVSGTIDKERMEEMLLHNQIGTLCMEISPAQYKDITALMQKSGITLERIQVAVIFFENIDCDKLTISLEALKHDIDKLISKSFPKGFLVFWYNNRIVIILNQSKISTKSIPSCFYEISRFMKNKFHLDCLIGFGEGYADINEIPGSYRQALYALSNNIYEERRHIFFYKPEWSIKTNIEEYYFEEKSSLFTAMNNRDREKSYKVIESFFKRIFFEKIPPIALYFFFNNVINKLTEIIHSNNATNAPVKIENQFDSDFVLLRTSINKSKLQLMKLIDEAINCNEATRVNQYGHFIDRVIRYLESNYKKDLCLESVCKHFNINVSYFCKIFKERTGKTYMQYLTDLRIGYAKDILKHENLKVYEVAELVGFKDAKYFAKIFKKNCNLTPLEYKTKVSIGCT